MTFSSFSRRSVAGRRSARAAATARITRSTARFRRAALLAIAAAAAALAAAAIGPASAHSPAAFNGQLFDPPALALAALDGAGNAQTGSHLHYETGADGRNRVQLTIKHWCVNTGYFNQYLCPMPGVRFRAHHAPITFYVFDGASGRAASNAVGGAKGYRPATGGGWSNCTSGTGDICVISASEHYVAEGTKTSWNTVSMTFQISFSVPSSTTGQIRVAAKHRHPHASSDTWTELGYAAAEPDLSIELTPYASGGSLETGDISANARTYAAAGAANKVRIRIMASATEPLRAAHFDHFTGVRIGIFAGASGRAASDAVGGAAVKTADGAGAWHGCQAAKSAQWPCTMTSALYAAAPASGTAADAERGVDFSFTLPSGTTGAVRLFAQFTHSSRAGSGSAELSYGAPPAGTSQPTAPVVQQLRPAPPKVQLTPYTPAGALETGDLSTNARGYVAGTGRQRVRLSVVDSDGDAVAYSKFDSIKITVFSGASGRADSQFIASSAAYAVAGGSWGACSGSGDHDVCVINRAGYKLAAGASSDDADIGAIEFAFSVPAGTTGGIRLAAALAPSDSSAAVQWTELAYQPQSSLPSDPQPQPVTSSPTPAAKLTPYTSGGSLETGDVSTNTRAYAKGAAVLNKVRLSIGPASGSGTITYADITKVEVYVFGAGSGRAAGDAISSATVRSSAGAAWSTCTASSSGHAICAISRAAWKTATGDTADADAVDALDFGFRVPAATSGGIRLAVALYPASGSTSWTEVAYDAPPNPPENPGQDPVAPTPTPTTPPPSTPSATPEPKLTPYTSGGTLEASGTASRVYSTGSTRNKVRLSVGPSSGNGAITYADIDKAAVYLFSAGSGRAISDALATGSIWAFNGRSWSSTCALPQAGFANCEISRAAWKTAAGDSEDSATVAALDFSFKLTAATSGGVRIAVALYATGDSTPAWTEVSYDATAPEAPTEPETPAEPETSTEPEPETPTETETETPAQNDPAPTPAAKLTPYTAAGELETGDVMTNSRQYATDDALNKVRLSIGPASGSGEINYAGIDKVAVHVFKSANGRAASDAVSGAAVRSSDGSAWSTCAAPSSGHAICEISRAAWKTADGGAADSATVAALDFSFKLAAATNLSNVRLAVALYAAGGLTPSWTEIAYGQPPAEQPPPPPPAEARRVVPTLPSTAPAAKLTPYAAGGTLETGDVSANLRRYSRGGTTLNKVRLSVKPQSGSGEIAYADIDKAAVHVFSGESGRNPADAFSGALVRSSTGTSWSACSAPSSGYAICEISRAAWKTAAGDSSDSDSVGALDFAFRLPASAAGAARLAVMLTAKSGGVISWAELSYSEPAGTGGLVDRPDPDATDVPEDPGGPDDPGEPGGPPAHSEDPGCTGDCESDGDPGAVKVASARLVRADGRAGAVPVNSDVPLRLVLRGPNGEFVPARAVRSIRLVILTGRGAAALGECPPGVACSTANPPEPSAEAMPGGPRIAFSRSADQPVEPLSLNFRAPDRAGRTEICAVIVNAAGGEPLLAEVIIDYVSTLPAARLRLGEPGRYLHRHATTGDDSDQLIFTAAAFDRNGDRSTMPQPTSVAVSGPGGEEIGIDRIKVAESCGYAGGSACRYLLSSTAPAGDPLDEGRYWLHLRAGRLSASVDFQVVGPAARIVLERAHPGAYGERFAIRARVYDRFGEPVADGTPVWISAVVRDQGLNHAVTSAGPVVPRRALTSAGSAVSSWAVLGRELAIVTALAGGERRDPHASTTAVIDTGLRGDCSARSLSAHQAGAYSFWLGGPGCLVSDLGDVLLDLTGSVWLWNGKTWLRYARDGGRAVPGSIDFDLREGDLLWLGDMPPDGAAA